MKMAGEAKEGIYPKKILEFMEGFMVSKVRDASYKLLIRPVPLQTLDTHCPFAHAVISTSLNIILTEVFSFLHVCIISNSLLACVHFGLLLFRLCSWHVS